MDIFHVHADGAMKAAIVIPARYASTRLPGKALLAETGKPLIQHVFEQAKLAKNAAEVVTRASKAPSPVLEAEPS